MGSEGAQYCAEARYAVGHGSFLCEEGSGQHHSKPPGAGTGTPARLVQKIGASVSAGAGRESLPCRRPVCPLEGARVWALLAAPARSNDDVSNVAGGGRR